MKNLNGITEGTELEFEGVAPGVVRDIWKQTRNGDGDVIEARLVVSHSDDSESYHTYRRDGRSHHNPSHDITAAN